METPVLNLGILQNGSAFWTTGGPFTSSYKNENYAHIYLGPSLFDCIKNFNPHWLKDTFYLLSTRGHFVDIEKKGLSKIQKEEREKEGKMIEKSILIKDTEPCLLH